jgi:hypothetical protein
MIIVIIAAIVLLMFGLVVFRGAPYVPSHVREVKGAFEKLYPLGTRDMLVDVGSGDGLVLREAASHGARAVGYEINPLLVVVSWLLAGRSKLIRTQLVDFWYKDLPSETTIVYAFTVSRDVNRLQKKMQDESDRLGLSLTLMTYGSPLKDKQAVKNRRGHHLYVFTPLQNKKA